MLTISSDELNLPRTNDLNNSKCICTINSCLQTCCLCLNAYKDNVDNVRILTLNCCGIKTKLKNLLFMFSLSIFYLPIKQTKWIRHK
jgi:hypothetical protein